MRTPYSVRTCDERARINKVGATIFSEIPKSEMKISFIMIAFLLEVSRGNDDARENAIVGLSLGPSLGETIQPEERFALKQSQCLQDFSSLFNTTDHLTGLSLGALALDASGKVGSGIHRGNTYALGDYDGCLDVGERHEGTVKYCIVHVSLVTKSVEHSPIMQFQVGMCVPLSCNKEKQYEDLLEETLWHYIHVEASKPVCKSSHSVAYSNGARAVLIVCGLFVTAAVVGTIADLALTYTCVQLPFRKLKLLLDIITAFSFFKNIRAISTTKQPSSTISSLNGIRVLSMFWIVLCHVHVWYTTFKPLRNQAILEQDVFPRLWYQAILNGYFFVDSFFLLSGTLAAYNNLRAMDRRKNNWCRFPILNYYVHRYLRLTMVYAFVVLFRHLVIHLSDGPIAIYLSTDPENQYYKNCDDYWWTNLLYINNIYPWRMRDQCMHWTWSLANDMQFYVIAPLILVPLYYSLKRGLAMTGLLLSFSFIITGTIAGVNDYSPISALKPFEPDGKEQTDDIYVKPYCRIAPYLVGLILGYVLHNRVQLPFDGAKKHLCYAIMWILAMLTFASILFGLYGTWYGHRMSKLENIAFYTFTHFAWGIGVALVVFACNNGYGWIINDFLSMKIWVPLSRLTYIVSLVHVIIIDVILNSARQISVYEDTNLLIYTISVVVLSYGASGILAVLVEFPLANVETIICKLLDMHREESVRLVKFGTKEEAEKKDD